jgi:hypothetical protein
MAVHPKKWGYIGGRIGKPRHKRGFMAGLIKISQNRHSEASPPLFLRSGHVRISLCLILSCTYNPSGGTTRGNKSGRSFDSSKWTIFISPVYGVQSKTFFCLRRESNPYWFSTAMMIKLSTKFITQKSR